MKSRIPTNQNIIAFADSCNNMLTIDEIITCFNDNIHKLMFPPCRFILALTQDNTIKIVIDTLNNTRGMVGLCLSLEQNLDLALALKNNQAVHASSLNIEQIQANKDDLLFPLIFNNESSGALLIKSESDLFNDETFINNIYYLCSRIAVSLNNAMNRESLKNTVISNNVIVDNADQLSVLTHELRTPLNGLLALTDVLHSTILDNNQKRIVDELGLSAKSLHRMIEQVLNYSKLRVNNKGSMTQKSFNVREVLNRVSSALFERANNKSIAFKTVCIEKIPDYIIGDESAIENTLFNIIGNCITYTDTGYVFLFVRFINDPITGYQIEFRIKDSGIGMAPEFVKRIFLPFVQEKDNPKNIKKRGGVGLGMAITRQYIDQLKGAISINSALDVGSEFIVTIPAKVDSVSKVCDRTINVNVVNNASLSRQLQQSLLNRNDDKTFNIKDETILVDTSFKTRSLDVVSYSNEHGQFNNIFDNITNNRNHVLVLCRKIDEATLIDQHIINMPYRCISLLEEASVENIVDHLVSFSYFSASLNVIDDIIADNVTIRRALIAEDDPVSQLALKLKLEDCNFMADVVNNGDDALLKLKERRYDLVALDVQMPKLDGIGVLENYDRSVNDNNTKFVMLSADGSDNTVSRCKELGADIFFTKPISERFTADISKLFNITKDNKNIAHDIDTRSDVDYDLFIYKFPSDIFNLDNLRLSLNNSHDHTKTIVLLFIDTSGNSVSQLKDSVKSKNSMMCRHYAHKLRSSAQQAFIHIFEDVLYKIEFSNNDNETIKLTKDFISMYYRIIERVNLVLDSAEWL